MDDIISELNKLLFRAGVLAGTWTNITQLLGPKKTVQQVVKADLVTHEPVYSSDFIWFFAAAFVQVLALLLILPIYWGWWKIGVELTLSPFQIAKTFNSPIFDDINSGAGASGIVSEAGDTKLRRGVIGISQGDAEKSETLSRFRVGVPESYYVSQPSKDMRFTD